MKYHVLIALALMFVVGLTVPDAGANPLFNAIQTGNVKAIKAMLTACADENMPSNAKELADWLDTCQRMDVNASIYMAWGAQNIKMTPLYLAAKHGHVEVITLLLAAGAHIYGNGGYFFETPLYAAIRGGHAEAVAVLIANGADGKGYFGPSTPLHWAVGTSGRPAVVNALLAAGADVNVQDEDGATPLHWAVGTSDRLAVVNALLAAGADVNVQDEDGATPLHRAAGSGRPAVVNALLTAGADANVQDSRGRTPLDRAKRARSWEVRNIARRPYDQVINMLEGRRR